MPLQSGNGVWGVYGMHGQGVNEAIAFCHVLEQNAYIRWNN